MSKAGRMSVRIAVTGILFLLLFSGSALAVKERKLTAACPSRSGEKITARWSKEEMILSVPGFWDLSAVTLEMEGTDVLFLGDKGLEIRAGEPADLTGLAGKKIRVRNAKKEGWGNLTILQGSEIPVLFLTVDADELKKINGNKDKEITKGRVVCAGADGTVAYEGALEQLKARGNNSFRYSKKPYQIKLTEKAPLFGMSRGKTWILLANWVDVSLLRNQIVLDMSREIGLRNALSCVQADVWINGVYNGLYLLTEKIQIGKNRIDITNLEKAAEKVNPDPLEPGKMVKGKSALAPLMRYYPDVKDPEDITGGYIMTIEKKARMKDYSLAGFRTEDDLSIHIKEPTYPSHGQAEYLAGLITKVQKALMAKDGKEPGTGKSYEEYVDTDSFARKLLIEDWCKNYDFFGGSQFLYKDSDRTDTLIYAGPSWDYDLSFGNMADRGYKAGGAYVTAYKRNLNLYWLLYNHEAFRKDAAEIWQKDFQPAVTVLLGEKTADPDSTIRSIDEYSERISASVKMNYKRWPVSRDASGSGSGGNFESAVKYLKKWIADRTVWMDGYYTPEAAATQE